VKNVIGGMAVSGAAYIIVTAADIV